MISHSEHSLPADIRALRPDHERVSQGDVRRGEIEIISERDMWCSETARLAVAQLRIPAHDGAPPRTGEEFRLAHAANQDDGVVVAPIDSEDRIIVVRQFRHPVRMWVRELPRGGRKKGEAVRDCAARELQEELGLELTECYSLGRLATDSGQEESVPHLVAARVTAGKPAAREAGEIIERSFRYRYSELRTSCERGDIIDGFTLATVLRLGPHFSHDVFNYQGDVLNLHGRTDR